MSVASEVLVPPSPAHRDRDSLRPPSPVDARAERTAHRVLIDGEPAHHGIVDRGGNVYYGCTFGYGMMGGAEVHTTLLHIQSDLDNLATEVRELARAVDELCRRHRAPAMDSPRSRVEDDSEDRIARLEAENRRLSDRLQELEHALDEMRRLTATLGESLERLPRDDDAAVAAALRD